MQPPTDLFIARLLRGGVFDDALERVRATGPSSFLFTDRGGPYAFEQPWPEAEVRERVARRLLLGGELAAPVEAFLDIAPPGDGARRVRELEPERAGAGGAHLDAAAIVAVIEESLRRGKTLYHCNHEGWDSWSFDTASDRFVREAGGEGGPERGEVDVEGLRAAFVYRYQVVNGVARGWPADLSDARDAAAHLGHPTLRAAAESLRASRLPSRV